MTYTQISFFKGFFEDLSSGLAVIFTISTDFKEEAKISEKTNFVLSNEIKKIFFKNNEDKKHLLKYADIHAQLTKEKKAIGPICLSNYNLTAVQEGIVVATKRRQLIATERKIAAFIKELKNPVKPVFEQYTMKKNLNKRLNYRKI
jgi:hypothetical protein